MGDVIFLKQVATEGAVFFFFRCRGLTWGLFLGVKLFSRPEFFNIPNMSIHLSIFEARRFSLFFLKAHR